MIRLILLTPLLCACDLNSLEGRPSAFRQHHEKMAAVVQTVPAVEAKPAVIVAEVEDPECIYDSFRVYRCIDGEIKDWWAQ